MFFNLLTVWNLLYFCQACESFEDRIDVIDLRGKRGLLLGDKYYIVFVYLKGGLGWSYILMFTVGGRDFLEQYKKEKPCFFPVKNIKVAFKLELKCTYTETILFKITSS